MQTSDGGRTTLTSQDLQAITLLAHDYPSVAAMEAAVRAARTGQRFSVAEVLRLHGAGIITADEARACLGWEPPTGPSDAAMGRPVPPAPPQPNAFATTVVAAAASAVPPSAPAPAPVRDAAGSRSIDAVTRLCWAIIWRFIAVGVIALLCDGLLWVRPNRVELILVAVGVAAVGYVTNAWRNGGFAGTAWRVVAAAMAVAFGAAGLVASASPYAIAAGLAICALEPALLLALGARAQAQGRPGPRQG